MTSEAFHSLKQRVLKKQFSRMNEMQQKAVFKTQGPILILAGAGSGKTTVLINRIAFLLRFGNAYYEQTGLFSAEDEAVLLRAEKDETDWREVSDAVRARPVLPWNVLAITFTNKAANELKERLVNMLGEDGEQVNAGTFHYICLRVLRREIEKLGYKPGFTIYDTDDGQRVVKDCLAELNLSDKMFPPKTVLNQISRAKDSMLTPEKFLEQNGSDFRLKVIGGIYSLYQKKLRESNAVDFDDIICLTVRLFEENPDVLAHYQNRWRYIMVDEYQDTNHAQYRLVSLLSGKYHNLCVVGDDDQSIYRFRGATIENILSFEEEFDDAVVIRLEQNYRSTQNILDAANELISHNTARKGKNLWTDNGSGSKVVSYRALDEMGEAMFVVRKIEDFAAQGQKFSDNAVLYRTNAQSNTIERQLVRAGIPYRIVGGTKFFDRKEIRDILAYFRVIDNPADAVRLKRIINEPKRGIGDATVKQVEEIAAQTGLPMFEVMKNAKEYAAISKKSAALGAFVEMIEKLQAVADSEPLEELLEAVSKDTGYADMLSMQGVEGRVRLENIAELKTNLIKYENDNEDGGLQGFLEEVSLFTDLDNLNAAEDSVTLMTMHSAKGLEFKNVYVVGLEENLFPSYQSASQESEVEEERRLAYVALTRAKEKLFLTCAASRMIFGTTNRNQPSRFLKEIPEHLLEKKDDTVRSFSVNVMPEKPKPSPRPMVGKGVGMGGKPTPAAGVSYAAGDLVTHKVFGRGRVVSLTPMGNDTLVEVRFDTKGTKKIMANFAKLTKIDG